MPHGQPLPTDIYKVLHDIAARQMAGERRNHTLGATALVHEAFVKLAKQGPHTLDAPAFYRQAGDAMRHILIDHARRRGAAKRGSGRLLQIENIDDLAEAASLSECVALDSAFVRLEQEDARAADVVRLRFYAGLTVDQTAEAMGISRRSVLRDWEFARAFLMAELGKVAESEGGAA
ncbi:MAG TPA: ECF-type sigma factor [Phycisphaerales bacterium]|nr:ECF-type sigma factor [Phycisphaerales bacterium]